MEIRPACLLCFRRRFACLCNIRNQLHKKKARQEKGNLRMKKKSCFSAACGGDGARGCWSAFVMFKSSLDVFIIACQLNEKKEIL